MKSIKTRITAFMGALLILVCSMFGGVSYYASYNSLISNVESLLPQMAKKAAMIMESRIQENLATLVAIAESDVVQNYSKAPDVMMEYLDDIKKGTDFTMLNFIDSNGDIPTATGSSFSLKDREYFIKAVSGEANVSDPIVSRGEDAPLIIMYAVPVKDEDKIIGVLVGAADGNALSKLCADIGLGNNSDAFIINSDGVTIAHQNRENVVNMVNTIEEAKDDPSLSQLAAIETLMKEGQTGFGSFIDHEIVQEEGKKEGPEMEGIPSESKKGSDVANAEVQEIPKFVGYTPVPGTEWSIAVTIPKAEVFAGLRRLTVAIVIITIVLMVLSISGAFMLASRTSKPIKLAAEHLEGVALGDFTKEFPAIYLNMKDEMGILAKSINKMQISLTTLIGGVKDASNTMMNRVSHVDKNMGELNEGIMKISATTEQISAGMEETAASSQEMNATTGEIENAIDDIAKEAQNGAHTANEISQRANGLRENVHTSQERAIEIYSATQGSLKNAIEQSKAVEQINTLSETILGIISQTNLLALNAAIEAARAGEAGKGFAVVADEIRKLAEDSKNTVSKIQNITETVVESVENLSSNSERILDFIDQQVIKDYKEMVLIGEQYSKDASFVDELMENLSATSQQLSASIQSVSQGISEISLSSNESADNTLDIANQTGDILKKSQSIIEDSNMVRESSAKLIEMIQLFKVRKM